MLNAVIDTNVFISGLLGSRLNRAIVLALKDAKFKLLISAELFDELLDVLTRDKFRNILSSQEVGSLVEIIRLQARFVTPRQKVTVCRDTEDQKVLECALEGANLVVTNDADLLCLHPFNNLSIITPKEFLSKLTV